MRGIKCAGGGFSRLGEGGSELSSNTSFSRQFQVNNQFGQEGLESPVQKQRKSIAKHSSLNSSIDATKKNLQEAHKHLNLVDNSSRESPTLLKIKVHPKLHTTTSKKAGRLSQLDTPPEYLNEWGAEEDEEEEDEEVEPMAPDFSTHNKAIGFVSPVGRNRLQVRSKDPF